MEGTVPGLVEAVVEAAGVLEDAHKAGELEVAIAAARAILSAGSKLHTRLGVLSDLRDEGLWTAEVDRAIRRAAAPAQLPGQLSIADASPSAPPRKGGGRGKKTTS